VIGLPAVLFSCASTLRSFAGSVNIPDQCRLFGNVNLSIDYPSGLSRIIVRRLTAIFPPTLS
jgi:hypothetical protein